MKFSQASCPLFNLRIPRLRQQQSTRAPEAISILLTCFASVFFFDLQPSVPFILGTSLVLASLQLGRPSAFRRGEGTLCIPGPSKRNIFLLITLFLLILPIERNFRNLRGNCKFHVPHPFCGKSCKFGHQKCAEIGGKCAEIGGKCAEIGGKCAEIGGKPKTNLF